MKETERTSINYYKAKKLYDKYNVQMGVSIWTFYRLYKEVLRG